MTSSMAYLILVGVGTAVQAFILWLAMTFVRVGSSFVGILILALVQILPQLFFPGFIGIGIGLFLFYYVGMRVTDANGFVDLLLVMVLSNIFGYFAMASIVQKWQARYGDVTAFLFDLTTRFA